MDVEVFFFFFYNFNQLTNLICKIYLIIWLYSTPCGDLNEQEIQKRGNTCIHMGFPSGSEIKNPPTMQKTWQSHGFNSYLGISHGGNGNLSGLLAWKSHGQRSLEDYSPWGHKGIGHDLETKQQQQGTHMADSLCCTVENTTTL